MRVELLPGPLPLPALCAAALSEAMSLADLEDGGPGSPIVLRADHAGLTADDLRWLADAAVGALISPEGLEIAVIGRRFGEPGGALRSVDTLRVDDGLAASLAERAVVARVARAHARAGVRIVDVDRCWIEPSVTIEPGAVIWPETVLRGRTQIAGGAEVRSGTWLTDTIVHAGAVIEPHCVCEGAEVGPDAHVGPMAHLRPKAKLGEKVKIGNFVEVKNTVLHAGAKASHLTYLGDAEVGAGANVGAGTITCNYDGFGKHRTVIGAGAFVGSNTALVAPVAVGVGAIIGAGSVITKDVPDESLAVERAEQRNLVGHAPRIRARNAARAAEAKRG